MFEKWTKKATTSAVENVKKTLNDRIDDWGDIIQFGLVLTVIILGGRHLTKKSHANNIPGQLQLPNGGQPIIINNYYTREREDIGHERREKTKQMESRPSYQRRQNGR